jgi:FkbM family methyltransferase
MEIKINYGITNNNINVTDICLSKLMHNNIITIPSGDGNRAFFFTDPLNCIHKKIFIQLNDKDLVEYDEFYTIKIDIINNTINAVCSDYLNDKILNMHSNLKLKYGSFNEELPEQKMAVRYLTGNEKVLEIGGNIGRNTLIIADILKKYSNNLVTLECDENIAKQLEENRDLNNFVFHIESSALSKRKLIQRGWDTIVSDTLKPGYKWVNTITLDELNAKYNIEFDTLVLDCEGAFYYILMDMPEILNNVNLIIMENDYYDLYKKQYVDEILVKNNFYRDYVEAGGWGCCYNNFFEVWKK